MAKTSFSIAYDGPALSDGTMDVRDLAPALLATSELFTSISKVLYGKEAKVRVSISATGYGSFEVFLDFVMSNWDTIADLFTGKSAQAIERIIKAIGGLFVLYKMLKGRKPSQVETLKNDKVAITVGDNRLEIEGDVYRICSSPDIQVAIQKLVHDPLSRDGITEFKSKFKDSTFTVSSDEAEYFSLPPSAEDEITEDLTRKAYKIASVSFRSENKWRLSDGSSTIYAAITDEDFLEKIEKNLVSFSKGDTLVCDVRTTQTVDGRGGLRTTYVIERVVKHIRPPNQLQIPDSE